MALEEKVVAWEDVAGPVAEEEDEEEVVVEMQPAAVDGREAKVPHGRAQARRRRPA